MRAGTYVRRVTAGGLNSIMNKMLRLCPSLEGLEVRKIIAGWPAVIVNGPNMEKTADCGIPERASHPWPLSLLPPWISVFWSCLQVEETWAGLRPTTEDCLPVLGATPWENLVVAGERPKNTRISPL
jgi:hypothetical protein